MSARCLSEAEAREVDLEDVRRRFWDGALDRVNDAQGDDRERLLAALRGNGNPVVIVEASQPR